MGAGGASQRGRAEQANAVAGDGGWCQSDGVGAARPVAGAAWYERGGRLQGEAAHGPLDGGWRDAARRGDNMRGVAEPTRAEEPKKKIMHGRKKEVRE